MEMGIPTVSLHLKSIYVVYTVYEYCAINLKAFHTYTTIQVIKKKMFLILTKVIFI